MQTKPKLDPETYDTLIENFFNPDISEFALCKISRLTLSELLDLYTSEAFQKTVADLEALRALRERHQLPYIRRDALAQLHNLAHIRSPKASAAEAARKAASALLKATSSAPNEPSDQPEIEPPQRDSSSPVQSDPHPQAQAAPRLVYHDAHAGPLVHLSEKPGLNEAVYSHPDFSDWESSDTTAQRTGMHYEAHQNVIEGLEARIVTIRDSL